jgi:uncharacterized membrane protein YqhA
VDRDDEGRRDARLHAWLNRLGHVIGRSRLLVLVAVVAVLLAALTLFLVGALEAVTSVWNAWRSFIAGAADSTELTVEFLGVVTTLLKAVVFYLIGVGLYSLFIAPLNVSISLGVETLTDLEARVVSIVIVIIAVTFLERFIRSGEPLATLQYAAAAALVIAALVFFQSYSRREKEGQQAHGLETRSRAQHEVFEQDRERHEVDPEERKRQERPQPDSEERSDR